MAKGNMNIKQYSPMVNNTPMDFEENKVLCQYALDIFNSSEPDLQDPVQVSKAINDYFNNCIEKGLRPGNLGLYASLGLNKSEVYDIIHGRIKSKASPPVIQLIEKAIKMLSSYRELLGSQGKLNPATLIFWQKNFDNLTDVQQIELNANTTNQPEMSTDEIRKQIENDIPIDTDYREIE